MAVKYYGVMMVNVQGSELLIVNLKNLKPLEHVKKDINLGDDVYQDQPVKYESVNRVSEALTGFIQILNDYGVTNYKLFGSNALHQALNSDFIADQLFLHTGMNIEWLSTSEETYFRNQNISVELTKDKQNDKRTTFLVGITSGNTAITEFKEGKFVDSTSFALGPIKIAEDLQSLRQTAPNSIGLLNDYIDSKLNDFYIGNPASVVSSKVPTKIILLGSLPLQRLVENYEHTKASDTITASDFTGLVDDLVDASDQFLIERLQVDPDYIPLVLPELLLTRRILRLTNASEIGFSDSGVVDGLVNQEALEQGYSKRDFTPEIIRLALNLSKHYDVELVHRDLVTKFALHLFDQLKPLHQLGRRERILLQVASILHDVGNYVGIHEHYLHSEYIILHSEIIGLSRDDIRVIAAIARYHSSTTPNEDLIHFQHISAESRRLIAKLAAILRLADALDDDRQQKIKKISVSIKESKVVITTFSNANLAYENWIFNTKSQFFTEAYGYKAVLKQRGVKAK
ncbi:HD domain-containing protein [Lentilactobacillus buchneri]|uniref:Ppx/GppA phosphatase family protein n=1 Tax=Lentilactobacillus buchneri TaxID=1581 RepID=UPI0021A6799D|nr:HD domain-containing protein [Lentilactobacillus buchneri]MCT2898323.1 HD domain-containing protein [Lentilactobacillus buchneri]